MTTTKIIFENQQIEGILVKRTDYASVFTNYLNAEVKILEAKILEGKSTTEIKGLVGPANVIAKVAFFKMGMGSVNIFDEVRDAKNKYIESLMATLDTSDALINSNGGIMPVSNYTIIE